MSGTHSAGRSRLGRTSMARVLVVEDEPGIRSIVGKVLEEAGYDVVLACHGAEALERMQAAPADCILLDLDMPVMDGRSFLVACRAEPAQARVPVALFTGAADGVNVAAALEVQAYIPKPFDLDAVTDTISRLVGPARSRRYWPTAAVAAVTPAHVEFLRQRAVWTRRAIARSQRTIVSAEDCLDQAGWGPRPSGWVYAARLR
jgi:CheY-like chemotaxis protein